MFDHDSQVYMVLKCNTRAQATLQCCNAVSGNAVSGNAVAEMQATPSSWGHFSYKLCPNRPQPRFLGPEPVSHRAFATSRAPNSITPRLDAVLTERSDRRFTVKTISRRAPGFQPLITCNTGKTTRLAKCRYVCKRQNVSHLLTFSVTVSVLIGSALYRSKPCVVVRKTVVADGRGAGSKV